MASEGEGSVPTTESSQVAKLSIKDELALLSKSGKVGNAKGKFKDAGPSASFMTPEQAKAFLAAQKNASKKGTVQPTPPSGLSSGELDSWYSQQTAKQAEERRKREEAEAILRGYRGAWDGSKSGGGGGGGGGSSGSLPPSGPDAGPDVSDARGMFQSLDKEWRKQGSSSEEEKKSEIDCMKEREAEWRLISNGRFLHTLYDRYLAILVLIRKVCGCLILLMDICVIFNSTLHQILDQRTRLKPIVTICTCLLLVRGRIGSSWCEH